MPTPNRREYLLLAGTTATTAIAGCIGGDASSTDTPDEDSGTTATPTSSEEEFPIVEASSDLDTNITFAIESETPDFETLVVDVDRIEFIGATNTDDATVRIEDTGLDFTALPDDGKTYLDNEPFPSGTYTSIDIYVTVQESSLAESGSATFDYEPPVSDDDTIEISDDQYQNFTYTIAAQKPFTEDTYTLSITGLVAYGAP